MKTASSGNDAPVVTPVPSAAAGAKPTAVLVEQLPREAGWLLVTAGIVGLAVPGVLGTPFLLAGAVILAPGGSKLVSRWAGRSTMRQVSRFLDDLERRYPRR